MNRLRSAAAPLLLVALWVALPGQAISSSSDRQPAGDRLLAASPQASLSSLAFLLQASSSRLLRERVIDRLAVPDTAVLILATGVLLIFVECNLPGAILPGAVGLLLVLSGIYGIALHSLRPSALLLLFAAGALLCLPVRRPLAILNALAGTAGLIYALSTLIPPANAPARVHLAVALVVGIVLGPSASLLAHIAERARRNKTILVSPTANAQN